MLKESMKSDYHETPCLFIEPTAAQLNIFYAVHPAAAGKLHPGRPGEPPASWHARVFVEGRKRFDLQAWIAEHGRPDVVGISTITATVKRGYALADECRALGIPVILGGPHVTFLPDEALAHAELVVRGEGEGAMNALLDLWPDGSVKTTDPGYAAVPNLSWKDAAGAMQHNPMAPWIADLDALPVPDFSLADGTADCRFGGKTDCDGADLPRLPFDCSFCSVTGMFGKKFRYRSVESVLQELRRYDSPRPLCLFLRRQLHGEQTPRPGAARSDEARKVPLPMVHPGAHRSRPGPGPRALMKRAGCHTVFIGFESVNPKSLTEMKKNQTLDDIRNAIRVIQAAGIHIHGMFVFGFEEDDWETVEATVRFAREMKLTSVQLLILTPLPGSELYERWRAKDGSLPSTGISTTRITWCIGRRVSRRSNSSAPRCTATPGFMPCRKALKKLATGRLVAAGLSFYAWKINRDWQKGNQPYLRELAAGSP